MSKKPAHNALKISTLCTWSFPLTFALTTLSTPPPSLDFLIKPLKLVPTTPFLCLAYLTFSHKCQGGGSPNLSKYDGPFFQSYFRLVIIFEGNHKTTSPTLGSTMI